MSDYNFRRSRRISCDRDFPSQSLYPHEIPMNLKAFAVLALAAVISIPAFAADDEKQEKKKTHYYLSAD